MTTSARKIAAFIAECIETYGYRGIVIGISGGIDSAVAAALCVQALGTDRVQGATLLERDSAPETGNDAETVSRHLNIDRRHQDISPVLRKMGVYSLMPSPWFAPRTMQERYTRKRWNEHSEHPYIDELNMRGNDEFRRGIAFYRAKHRARMAMLYMEAEKRGYAVCGATNKTELKTGLYVKFGDDAADVEPLAHLYKTQIHELAAELELPENIRSKSPSPDLIPGLDDERILGVNYDDLDRILQSLEAEQPLTDEDPETVERVRQMVQAARRRAAERLSPNSTLP